MTIIEKFLLDNYILPRALRGIGKGNKRLDYIIKSGWYSEFLEYINAREL